MEMYDRKLALRMVADLCVFKTSVFTNEWIDTKTHVSDMISLAFSNLTDKIIMGCFDHVWNTYVMFV